MLHNFSLKILSLFGSKNICESTFSIINLIKSKLRNRINNLSLESYIKLTTSGYSIDIEKLTSKKQCQLLH